MSGKESKTSNAMEDNPTRALFSYSPVDLGKTGFRILELLPSSTAKEQLACRLLASEIGQPVQSFKALSYTWGNGGKSRVLAVFPSTGSAQNNSSTALAITESLHAALVHLRHSHDSIWLWVDQVCINQEDHAEKAEQVRLMGLIFAKAEQVLVWLGPAADGSDALMDAWQSVGQGGRDFGMESYFTKERWSLLDTIMSNADSLDPKTAEFQTLLRTAAETFAPLIAGYVLRCWFARPWFERAWTVQEFCLCPNTAFVCGTKTVQVELVMLAIQILQFSISSLAETVYAPAKVPLSLLDEISQEPTGRLFSCRQRRRKFDAGEPDATGDQLHALLRKLYVGHSTQASLHRDRIFSLLGLAVDAPALDVAPDYTDPTPAGDARILTAAARAMITNPSTGRIDILSFSQRPKHHSLAPYLPSWVPDWRSNLSPSFYPIHDSHLSTPLFCACGPSNLDPLSLPSPSSFRLTLSGYFVSPILTISNPWDDNNNNTTWSASRLATLLSQIAHLHALSLTLPLSEFYTTPLRRAQALWRVPTTDLYWTAALGTHRSSPAAAEARHAQAVEAVRFLLECEGLEGKEREKRFKEWDWEGKAARGEVGVEYGESVRFFGRGKRPFLTEAGLLGMGPGGVRAGDVVVVFCGGRVPFVLRPDGEKGGCYYELVGEAYCDGVMDGEVVARRERRAFCLV